MCKFHTLDSDGLQIPMNPFELWQTIWADNVEAFEIFLNNLSAPILVTSASKKLYVFCHSNAPWCILLRFVPVFLKPMLL